MHPKAQWTFLGEGISKKLETDADDEDERVDYERAKEHVPHGALDESRLIPTGEVVGILESHSSNRSIVAFMPSPISSHSSAVSKGKNVRSAIGREENILVIPLDRFLPRFRVTTRQRESLQGKKVVIRMGSWHKDSAYPNAYIIHCFGESSNFASEMSAILIDNDIYNRPFSANALACLPSLSGEVVDKTSTDIVFPSNLVQTDCLNPEMAANKKVWVDSGWKVPPHLLLGRRDLRKSRTIFR